MKKVHIGLLMLSVMLSTLSVTGSGQQKTVVNDATGARKLLGRHMLSLQWISWDHFGTATVTQKDGIYQIRGEQKGRVPNNTDFLKLDGMIYEINATSFGFSGRITTQISHINGGQPCKREGEFTFAIKGKRKYWRMQEMDNPCDPVTDYIDVYLR